LPEGGRGGKKCFRLQQFTFNAKAFMLLLFLLLHLPLPGFPFSLSAFSFKDVFVMTNFPESARERNVEMKNVS
jgi:hypothetical protein